MFFILFFKKSEEKAKERQIKKAEALNYKLSLKNNVLETKDNAAIEKEKALLKNKIVHDQNKAVKPIFSIN